MFKNCQEAIIENDCENEQKFCDMCFKKYHEPCSPLFHKINVKRYYSFKGRKYIKVNRKK